MLTETIITVCVLYIVWLCLINWAVRPGRNIFSKAGSRLHRRAKMCKQDGLLEVLKVK